MNRRAFLSRMGKAALGLAVGNSALNSAQGFAATPGERLNFVFILIDDLGWTDVGCYGSTFYETPNIDRLAAEGMRFTQAYAACPVCSPTRASIMAGKYPPTLNLTNFIYGYKIRRLIPPHYRHELPLEEATLGEAFQSAGYATGFIGKWHLGGKGFFPEDQGFDVCIGGHGGGMPRSYFDPYKVPNLPNRQKGEYLTDRLTNEAVGFLVQNKDKPFLLFLSHYAVHIPLQAKKDMVAKYGVKAEALPSVPEDQRFAPEGANMCRQVQDHPTYAAMVQSVDESVGRVMRNLDELGIADNTTIIFMSDNGGLSTAEGSPTANVPLRAGKGWLYEGGIREPMIIKWPGVTEPGSVCDAVVTSVDFYPTMLEMAGLEPPASQALEGVSLVPLLEQTGQLQRDAIYWHYPHYGNQGGSPGGAIRQGDYKLIEFYEDGRLELYNLKTDVGEQNNLAEAMPDKAEGLRKQLDAWRKAVNADMPKPNPDYEP